MSVSQTVERDQAKGTGKVIKAPHGRSWVHYVLGVILNAVLFLIAGPLLGTLAGGLMLAFLSLVGNHSVLTALASMALFFPFALSLGYLLAWKAALITGALVAVMSSFVGKPLLLYIGSAVVGIIASLALVPANWSSNNLRSESPLPSIYFILAAVGAISAVLCTRFAASIRLRPENVAITVTVSK
jgi:hypothetical protein